MLKEIVYRSDGYFEGIIQLRPFKKEIYDLVLRDVKRRKDCEIFKEVLLKTGMDIYVTNQRFAISLGRNLKKSFKGKLLITRKLHTRGKMSGKKVYRVTVLFRAD